MYRHHRLFCKTTLIAVAWMALVISLCPVTKAVAADRLQVVSEKIFADTKKELMWQTQTSKRLKSPKEVVAYLEKINKGQYSDWRLPTGVELFTLTSIFDMKQNGAVKIRVEGKFWLSDQPGDYHVGSWEIGDGCGPSRSYYEGEAGYVRAVRP
ncbi:Lcl domain-containing protein [Desulforhopalus singaporensis]|uniref:Lcl C-terminal domain-containing protein n=1 Tax=Desulforhopalus singaporensis TaxID=91360 RepID=A0A1H0LEF5_9BACT|nr:DUF1566 domain-containing protein [Desulforhopalus singaporensis]SDO66423.1 Protein of unknown function [Desulforhopalus singaporensis]